MDVSRLGGLRQRSVFGSAWSEKEPMYSGRSDVLRPRKEELSKNILEMNGLNGPRMDEERGDF